MTNYDITIRVEVDDATVKYPTLVHDSIHALASVMEVQAEDGLYTAGYLDAESFEKGGDTIINQFVGHCSAEVIKVERVKTEWRQGDVVQTVVPYDDFPITVVRGQDRWNAAWPGGRQQITDQEVDVWLEEGSAVVKIQQGSES